MNNNSSGSWEKEDDFVVTTDVDHDENECSDVEKTILAMEKESLCFHPKHCHSFQQVSFMLSLKKCAGCHQRLQTVLFGGVTTSGFTCDTSKQIVRCVACGAVAHRSCALSDRTTWTERCPVNGARIMLLPSSNNHAATIISSPGLSEHDDSNHDDGSSSSSSSTVASSDDFGRAKNAQTVDHLEENSSKSTASPTCAPSQQVFRILHLEKGRSDVGEESQLQSKPIISEQPQPWSQWTPPPSRKSHVTSIALPKSESRDEPDGIDDGTDDNDDPDNEHVHVTPLHYANHPFASVSRAVRCIKTK